MSQPLVTEARTPLVDSNGMMTGVWQRKWSGLAFPQFSDAETPSGTIDGSNKVFTLASQPNPAASLLLFLNSGGAGSLVLQLQGTDYTISGNTVTFGSAPAGSSVLLAWYRY